MKSLLLVVSLFICGIAKSSTYYVSPTGSDSNPGTITQPFKSVQKLSTVMVAGDIAYIRGGTYMSAAGNAASTHFLIQNLTGTASNPIKIWAYPGETPMFDCSNITPSNGFPFAFALANCEYVHLKGLTVKNLKQIADGSGVSRGFALQGSDNCTIEQLNVFNIGGTGCTIINSNKPYFLNCDSHNNGDGMSPDQWNFGDGFTCTGGDASTDIIFEGCRAWMNGDDNWDFFAWAGMKVTIKNCWAFWASIKPWGLNGTQPEEASITPSDPSLWQGNNAWRTSTTSGEGFKLGGFNVGGPGPVGMPTTLKKFLDHCVSFENSGTGYAANMAAQYSHQMQMLNCIAYGNGNDGFGFATGRSVGIAMIFKNCIATQNNKIQSGGDWAYDGLAANVSRNCWMSWYGGINYGNLYSPIQANAADFLSTSSAGVTGVRQADGSLPNLNFLKLAPGSDLIDAGVNVGLPFNGAAPDLGPFESGSLTNSPPTANAGADQTITMPVSIATLSGSGTDPDGTIASYSWKNVSGPLSITLTTPLLPTTIVSALLLPGVYQFELTVTDNAGASAVDTMKVIVNPLLGNQAPTANAGLDQSITLPVNSVNLTGTGNDPDGTITSYLWTKISGPAAGTITNANNASTSVSGLVTGVYQFRLTVTDNLTATGTDIMQVTVDASGISTPYGGTPQVIPGLIEFEDYDDGGQDVAYFDNSTENSGGAYRPDEYVDIEMSAEGSPNVGWTEAGEWMKYTVNVLTTGSYTIQTRVATEEAGTSLRIEMDGTTIATIDVPATGGYQTWQTVSVSGVALSAGTKVMRVYYITGGYNLNNVVFSITPANHVPVSNAGVNQTITLPTNSVTLSGSGTDPDGTITGYLWTKISGPAAGTITNAASAATTVTGLAQGIYRFQLRVTDNSGATDLDTMQVTVNAAPNQAPTANAGVDQTITLPTNLVSLNGSGTDPDGTITAYLWTKISGPTAGNITNATSATTTVTGLVQGIYQFQLRVTDNNGITAVNMMQVTVNAAANQAPTAEAGSNLTITLPINFVTVSGNGTDPDGTITAYLWTKVSGPASSIITNATAATTTITALTQGVYQFQLQVTDDDGAIDTDIIQVNVNAAPPPPNQAPTANAGLDQNITLPTNSVSLNGGGTDPDGTITAYFWRKLSGPANGTISNVNIASTTVTGMVQGIYRFELRVTDNSGATARDTMQVTVNVAPNQVPTANAGADKVITLPVNTVLLSGSAVDPDGTITAYLWTKISGPASGTITNANAAATTVTGLVQGIYQFQLRVTDNSGASAIDIMQVTVNAAPNQVPTANAGLDQNITLPTNSVSLNGSGTDPDGTITAYLWTKISGPAVGTVTNPNAAATGATGLVQGVYQFQLRVTDNSGATATDIMQVTVNPPVNQLPTANAGLDQNITLPTNSVSLNGSGIDPDGAITAYLWTKISGPAAGTITNVNSATTSATGLVQGIYRFQLRVTDNSGATATDIMQVTVNPALNQLPTANANIDQTITLPTNSVSLNGSGIDPDGTITAYLWTKISGPAAGTITNVNSATTSATALVLGIYKFQLRVTDNNGATDLDTMQVTVNPAPNQLPTANANIDQAITLPTNSVSLNGSGTDPDGTIVAYLWTKTAGPAAGTITNSSSASTSVTGLVQGIYTFQLRVTDNSGATATDIMQVTVNAAAPPPNQAPIANANTDQVITLPTNAVSLNGSGTDPDGTITAYLWTKTAGPVAGTITNATSATTTATGLVQGVYTFQLRVTDNSGATATDVMQVTVNAAAPTPNQGPIADANLDQTITLPVNTVSLIGSATDPDGTITAYLWTKTAGPAAGTITNAASATTTVTGLAEGIYTFQLKVTDNGGATATDIMTVTVLAAPPAPVNIAPVANAGSDTTIYLPVNATMLTGMGTDPDGSVVSYSWTIISGGAHTLNNAGNSIANLNSLQLGVYQAELTVTDNAGAIAKDTVKVTVAEAAVHISKDDVKILGNPVGNTLMAEISSTTANRLMKVVLFDINGKVLVQKDLRLNQHVQVEKIDMSKYSKGTYILQVYYDKKSPVAKTVIKL